MSDTIPTEPNASGVSLPSRAVMREVIAELDKPITGSRLTLKRPGDGGLLDPVMEIVRAYERGALIRAIVSSNPSSNVTIEPGAITIENPLQDATEAATRIVKSIEEISRPIGEARPTVGQSEAPTQIKTSRVEDLHRGDIIRFNHEDRTVTCLHTFGRDVQVCMADTDDVSSQPFFKTDRETLVDVVGFAATTPEPEPEIPDEPVAVAAGGWCAPSDRVEFWPYPEITVRRGGISFTKPKSLTKKQLRVQNDRLVKGNESLRKENRKLAKKVRRLSKAVNRLARA